MAGGSVKFFQSRGGGPEGQRGHDFAGQQNVVTAEAAPTLDGAGVFRASDLPARSLSQPTQCLYRVPLPAHVRHSRPPLSGIAVSEAFACWGERVASGFVKFFGHRGGGCVTRQTKVDEGPIGFVVGGRDLSSCAATVVGGACQARGRT